MGILSLALKTKMEINEKNIEKAKRMIKDCKEKPIIVVAQDDDFNRKMIEYGKFDVLLGVENLKAKNSLRHLNSGFNHILARAATKNKVSLGIDLNTIRLLEKKDKPLILEKIRQNLKVCKKAGVKIKLLNIKDKKDAFAFLISLEASTSQAKQAISF